MVMRLFKLGWRGKAKVPTDQYAAMLSTVLTLVDTPSRPADAVLVEALAQLRELESIAPEDSRLSDVHMRAVGYLRCYLKIQDLDMTWAAKRMAGQYKEASKDFEEKKRYVGIYDEVLNELRQAAAHLKSSSPTLFNQLSLPNYLQ